MQKDGYKVYLLISDRLYHKGGTYKSTKRVDLLSSLQTWDTFRICPPLKTASDVYKSVWLLQ